MHALIKATLIVTYRAELFGNARTWAVPVNGAQNNLQAAVWAADRIGARYDGLREMLHLVSVETEAAYWARTGLTSEEIAGACRL